MSETATLNGKKMKVVSRPALTKPKDMELDVIYGGTLKEVFNSPVPEIKGRLMILIKEDGTEICLAETAQIRSRFEENGGAEKLLGKVIGLRRTGTTPSKKGQPMHVFDVLIEE